MAQLRPIPVLVFLLAAFFAEAQPTPAPNKTDAQGRKQGYWEKHHAETSQPAYKANFKDDMPVGVLQRFYEDGTLQAEVHYGKGNKGRAKIFYPDSTLMAEGNYLNQERDSIWRFYAPDSVLKAEEYYVKGKKNGVTRIYFEDGSISEKITYKNDIKQGEWEQFYPNGQPKLKANVVDGVQYEGDFTSYYDDGKKHTSGKYVGGKKESSWYHYHPDGSVEIIYVYRNDRVAEEHPQNGTFDAYFEDDIKRSMYTYKNGEKHGPFKEFYHQGEWRTEEDRDQFGNVTPVQRLYGTQVQREGKYFEGALHGEIVTYKPDGKIEKREKYEKGVMVK